MMRIPALAFAALVLSLSCGMAQAQGRQDGHNGHGSWHHHHHGAWGGVGLGIGFGWWPNVYGDPYWGPAPVVMAPPPMTEQEAFVPPPPDPVFTARQGQDAAQTESDWRACTRWVMTQSSAMNDASVFQRMALDCMRGRGYSVR